MLHRLLNARRQTNYPLLRGGQTPKGVPKYGLGQTLKIPFKTNFKWTFIQY